MSKTESQYVDIVQEFMNRAYIDGRDTARNHLPDEVPDEYKSNPTSSYYWITGYNDVLKEEQEYRFSV